MHKFLGDVVTQRQIHHSYADDGNEHQSYHPEHGESASLFVFPCYRHFSDRGTQFSCVKKEIDISGEIGYSYLWQNSLQNLLSVEFRATLCIIYGNTEQSPDQEVK